MAYSPAGDLVQSIGDAAGQQARALDAEMRLAEARRTADVIDTLRTDNAANLAEKCALRAALRRLAPDHPLLTNADLRDKIHQAGVRAFSITNEWAAAREAGETFKY